MMLRSLCVLTLALSAAACSSSDGTGPGAESTDADADVDAPDVACTYPPPHNDPRCDTIVFGASCDGSFSCKWPGYGDCPVVGCCADKICSCNLPPHADAGVDGGALGVWTCAQ